ncbi:MAG: molybdate ABC transporter substrate-binding protein [Polyangiales bacterium]
MRPRVSTRLRALALLLASMSLSVITSCRRAPPAATSREDGLVVFAAASLRDVFTTMAHDFEGAHAGVKLTFDFAGTQELRAQLEHGVAADVFAAADTTSMDALAKASRVVGPVVFARNEPVIVVARESADTIRSIADLPSASRLVLGVADVPIGRYSLQILDRAALTLGADFRSRVEAKVVSRELNVRQVLTKVSLGEAQAGIVYRTDARAADGSVTVVAIPAAQNVVASYPVAVVSGAPHPLLARAWVDFVLSPAGRQALESAGFLAPAVSPTP